MRYIYIYIYIYIQICICKVILFFVEKCECECKKLFRQKSECECKKVEKMSYPPLSLAIYVWHTRYFAQDILLDFWTTPRGSSLILLSLFLFFVLFLCSFLVLTRQHFIFFFDFLKEIRLKKLFCSHFPRVHANQKLHLTLLFSLKERARKLSRFFLSKPTVNTSKER